LTTLLKIDPNWMRKPTEKDEDTSVIDRIKREFARVMSGTYHKRIGYTRAAGVPPELETAERA
jgi:hypothetical protein